MGTSHSKVEDSDRVLVAGRPNYNRCDNVIVTSKYTAWTFLPVAVTQQFRRFANMYFLCVGIIMAIGYYTDLYESAISPWTTLGPLAFVISVSLLVEGIADRKRHRSDKLTNNAPCVILRRSDEIDHDEHAERETSILNGKDIIVNLSKMYFMTSTNKTPTTPQGHQQQSSASAAAAPSSNLVRVGFQSIKRMDIRQGHVVLIRNREMVPADTILLASSGDNGGAYIETSSIDGETNLKLRSSPHLPYKLLKHLRDGTPIDEIPDKPPEEEEGAATLESIEQATKRICRFSALAYPDGTSALDYPGYQNKGEVDDGGSSKRNVFDRFNSVEKNLNRVSTRVLSPLGRHDENMRGHDDNQTHYVAALTSEPPNAHVNTFSGKLTLPPVEPAGPCIDIPLGADNILLRGAVLRNTEWAIGLSCFTGTDTKLIQNSFQTPSKFSQLDVLMNKCVAIIIVVMCLCIAYLATSAVISMNNDFNYIWYIGFNGNTTDQWPYLPKDLPPPQWETSTQNWFQMFFLYVTLLSNFVPLSMYVTVEMINFFFLWLVYNDVEMYDDRTDTRAVARSTNVTDLGQVQYIFSDKTGTLTQNVMRFKRCSVDGMVFGAPVEKARPGESAQENDRPASAFHPLRQLLVGSIDDERPAAPVTASDGSMTFNAEMFLRVLSLCHTVVVEKDLDLFDQIDESKSVSSVGSSWSATAKNYTKKFFTGRRDRTVSDMSASSSHAPVSMLETVAEDPGSLKSDLPPMNAPRNRTASAGSVAVSTQNDSPLEKGPDGAPAGFAYQAESPDEGALVSEASKAFGFQVIGRDSSGIKIRVDRPTIFLDDGLVAGLKTGALNPKQLAADTATGHIRIENNPEKAAELNDSNGLRTETWSILAVNKFDSDRKRMSILLRSPPELGSAPILFCKGADSAMLDPSVCSASKIVLSGNEMVDFERSQQLEVVTEDEESEFETAQLLGMQSHLGEFATEGLRTLVLGVRFVTEAECAEWLEMHKQAATSIKDREGKLKEAALKIETNIHIVGSTAIEDKLQDGVPNTIATLEKAGIKLWVLTGDKRETAIEIGYSTHVLTPKMHLTEMADKGEEFVRAQCAMEFMRLVKAGKLPLYQRAAVDQADDSWTMENFKYIIGKFRRRVSRALRSIIIRLRLFLRKILNGDTTVFQEALESISKEEDAENEVLKDVVRRRNVRDRAEKVIRDYMSAHGHEDVHHDTNPISPSSEFDTELSTDELPAVFNRAQSARTLLEKRGSQRVSQTERRSIQLAQLTAQEAGTQKNEPVIEEDMLSLASFLPASGDAASDFDKKRRTVLERMFAVDRDVRKGKLVKHLKKEVREELKTGTRIDHHDISPSGEGPRALVVEGAALSHLLGDLELEELIFNIASQCDAVIACRVSPRQKALLVKLVRQRVVPEPVTLAIGDGANDVGMIQEAHVGIGISGKEGKQAVNASDFAIAQFRFLESLVLVHGRWDFMRLSVVVLYSFYKNACMAGCLILYNGETLFSGTPLFDEWVIAILNFVAGLPILFLGMFDRCLDKDYVLRNPEVYKPARDNELITIRVLLRWVIIAFAHIFILYFGSLPQLTGPGGMTSAFSGLMGNKEVVGNGEGGDLQSVGTVIFTSMIFLLAYKILYESRSIINGRWPAITCGNKKAIEGTGCHGFWNRLPYTWYSVTYGSIIFFVLFLFIYQRIGQNGPGEYFNLVGVPDHIFGTRSINYLSILFVPIGGMAVDLAGKVFSNMFYPTQTQIHVEIESKQFAEQNAEARRRKKETRTPNVNGQPNDNARGSDNV
mmetsp:Transcript_15351/g.38040  ORF Transcript_15351/g.38040 Transcript_15351/m.38040 type:complete len:1784 (+) Transcript_15351:307-5658(+)